jgi:hypothetical protein
MIFRKFLPFLMIFLFIVSSCQGNQPNSTVNNDNKKENTINLLTGKPMTGKPLLNDSIVFRSDEAQKFLNMNYEQRTKYFNERKSTFKIKDLVDNNCIYDQGYLCKDENGRNAICYRKAQGNIDSCGRCQLNDLFYGQHCSYTANQPYYLSEKTFCATKITYTGIDYHPVPYPSCASCQEGYHPVPNETYTWFSHCEENNNNSPYITDSEYYPHGKNTNYNSYKFSIKSDVCR